MGPRASVTKDTVSADNHIALGNAHKQKQPCRDIQIRAGEGLLGEKVPPDGVSSERGQSLMGAEEELVGESAEE